MTARSPQRQQLIDLLGPVVGAQGYDLEDVSVTAAGRRSLIRITVDSEDGIDLDGVAEVSRIVSDALDEDAAAQTSFAGPYVLEVSSPGTDRPLTELRHWRRAVGRLVAVTISEPPAADTHVIGRVIAAEPEHLMLELNGTSRQFGWQVVGKGRVQLEFSRPGEPELEEEDG